MPVFEGAIACPSCKTVGPMLLEEFSKDARVNFYQCPRCAHVWTTTKDGTIILRHVTTISKMRLKAD